RVNSGTTRWGNQPQAGETRMKKIIADATEARTRILAELRKVKGCENTADIEVEHRGQGWFVTHVHPPVEPTAADLPRDKIFVEARKIAAKLS
ncbi:MAG TPA: hypothetical protein VN229_21690, partial [Terriglobales bacterium]|nr:hypothetical protein [Terriglobales bacterium]